MIFTNFSTTFSDSKLVLLSVDVPDEVDEVDEGGGGVLLFSLLVDVSVSDVDDLAGLSWLIFLGLESFLSSGTFSTWTQGCSSTPLSYSLCEFSLSCCVELDCLNSEVIYTLWNLTASFSRGVIGVNSSPASSHLLLMQAKAYTTPSSRFSFSEIFSTSSSSSSVRGVNVVLLFFVPLLDHCFLVF